MQEITWYKMSWYVDSIFPPLMLFWSMIGVLLLPAETSRIVKSATDDDLSIDRFVSNAARPRYSGQGKIFPS